MDFASEPSRSRNDIWRQLILEKGQAVAQDEFAFLEPLDLQLVRRAKVQQRLDRGVEIAVLLSQMLELSLQRSALLVAHLIRHVQQFPKLSQAKRRLTHPPRAKIGWTTRLGKANGAALRLQPRAGFLYAPARMAALAKFREMNLRHLQNLNQPIREALREFVILWHTRFHAKTLNKEFCMSVISHLAALEQRHDALDKEIEKELVRPATDELKLAEMKRRKLQLKDEITKLRGDQSFPTLH